MTFPCCHSGDTGRHVKHMNTRRICWLQVHLILRPIMLSFERFTDWSFLRHVCLSAMAVTLLAGISQACEAPGQPQCFKTNSKKVQYRCEWRRSFPATNVTYDLLINTTDNAPLVRELGLENNWIELDEAKLIKGRNVYIVVTAHLGNTSCSSANTSVELDSTVKFLAPVNIKASWSDHKLNLTWRGQMESASVDVLVRSLENPTLTWRYVKNASTTPHRMYWVLVEDVQGHMAYQVQVRQRSTNVNNSLWSEWSSNLTVPAEIKQPLEVEWETEAANGTRRLVFTWKAEPPASRVGGLDYNLAFSQHCCPCRTKKNGCGQITVASTNHIITVTFSAVNFSITANNSAGFSNTYSDDVPATLPKELKACEEDLRDKVPKKSCMELYEFKGEDTKPHEVHTFKKKIPKNNKMKDFVGYIYLEHRCVQGIPKTENICLWYRKEGAPTDKPARFAAMNETESSVDLLLLPVPHAARRGFITHYSLCYVRQNQDPHQEDSQEECRNLTGYETRFTLRNLRPDSRYNLSLSGVTRKGPGPPAFLVVNTDPHSRRTGGHHQVVISLVLLVSFFTASVLCSSLVMRLKGRILPPVPVPVVLSPRPHRAAHQEKTELRETMDEVSVHQPILGRKPHWVEDLQEDMDIANALMGTEEDPPLRGESPGVLEEVVYRNGLVFDMKT